MSEVFDHTSAAVAVARAQLASLTGGGQRAAEEATVLEISYSSDPLLLVTALGQLAALLAQAVGADRADAVLEALGDELRRRSDEAG